MFKQHAQQKRSVHKPIAQTHPKLSEIVGRLTKTLSDAHGANQRTRMSSVSVSHNTDTHTLDTHTGTDRKTMSCDAAVLFSAIEKSACVIIFILIFQISCFLHLRRIVDILFFATFRVARLTLQTPKLWFVGRCRDRPWRASPSTCPNVKNLEKIQQN